MPCGHCGAIRCEDSAHVHKSEAVAGPPIQGRNRESGLMCARGGAPQGRRERARDARAPQAATCAQLPTQGQGARANVRGLVLTSPPPPSPASALPNITRPNKPQHLGQQYRVRRRERSRACGIRRQPTRRATVYVHNNKYIHTRREAEGRATRTATPVWLRRGG